jgi:hypothetical protein
LSSAAGAKESEEGERRKRPVRVMKVAWCRRQWSLQREIHQNLRKGLACLSEEAQTLNSRPYEYIVRASAYSTLAHHSLRQRQPQSACRATNRRLTRLLSWRHCCPTIPLTPRNVSANSEALPLLLARAHPPQVRLLSCYALDRLTVVSFTCNGSLSTLIDRVTQRTYT